MTALLLEILLPILLPIIVCVVIGYLWAKQGNEYPSQFISQLVLTVGAPALILSVMGRVTVASDDFFILFMATLLLVAVMGVLGCVIPLWLGHSRSTYWASFVFPNVGNMGLPVCLFAFGEQGLVYALVIFMILSLGHFPLGMVLARFSSRKLSDKQPLDEQSLDQQLSGERALGKDPSGTTAIMTQVLPMASTTGLSQAFNKIPSIFKMPILWSIGITLYLIITQQQIPNDLSPTIDLLAGITIPLMLITLGVSLATLSVDDWLSAIIYSLIRIFVGTAAGWGITLVLGIEGMMQSVFIMQAGMPVAVFNYLFALNYNKEPDKIAGLVIVSTMLAMLWVPLMLMLFSDFSIV